MAIHNRAGEKEFHLLMATCEHLMDQWTIEDGLPRDAASSWVSVVLPLHHPEMTVREGWDFIQGTLARRCGCTIPKHLLEGDNG